MGEPVCLPQPVSTTQRYRHRHTEKFSQNLAAAATWASGERKGRRRARDKGAPLPTTQLPSASCSRRSVTVASRGGAKGRSAAVGWEVLRVYSALNTYYPPFPRSLSAAAQFSRSQPPGTVSPPLLLLASSFCLCSLFHAARVRSQGNRRRHHVRDQKAKGGRYRLANFCLRARRPTGVLPAPSGRPGVISTQPSRALTHADRSALTRAHHPRFSSCCLIGC